MHIPLSYAFFPPFGFHLFSALTVGITAGFCEEVLYRAFLMTKFAEAVPAMIAHFLNDATALHWIGFFMITARP